MFYRNFDLWFDIHIIFAKRVSKKKRVRESGFEPTPIQDLNPGNRVSNKEKVSLRSRR